MKRQKYQDIECGQAGSGKVNLATGALILVHNTTSADSSILPIAVSHVYMSEFANQASQNDNSYGKGWKLSLEKTLKLVSTSTDSTEWEFTDNFGKTHSIKQKYFYWNNANKIDVLPKDIKISQEGRLWLISNQDVEVFAQTVSDEKFEIITRPNENFVGYSAIRHRVIDEDTIRIEEEIKNLNRMREDLQNSLNEYANMIVKRNGAGQITNDSLQAHQRILEQKSLQLEQATITQFMGALDNLNGIRNADIASLINNNSQIDKLYTTSGTTILTGNSANRFDSWEAVKRQESLQDVQTALRVLVRKGMNDSTVIQPNDGFSLSYWQNIANYFKTGGSRFVYNDAYGKELAKTSFEASFHGIGATDKNNDNWWDFGTTQIPAVASIVFGETFNTRVEKLRQVIDDLTASIEKDNWKNQKNNVLDKKNILDLQTKLTEAKRQYEILEQARLEELIERAERDIVTANDMMSFNTFVLEQLQIQTPVNYLRQENLMLGFNMLGKLVVAMDNYDNRVAILYKDGQIDRVVDTDNREILFEYVDGRLNSIRDFVDCKTHFEYDEMGRLTSIQYANGEQSIYEYDDNDKMVIAMPACKVGIRFGWLEDRVCKIAKLSHTSGIGVHGVDSGDAKEQSIIELYYYQEAFGTAVVDAKTREQVTYGFYDLGYPLHEYVQREFEEFYKTTRETDKHCVIIKQKLHGDTDMIQIQQIHLDWTTDPDSLPQYREDLEWTVIEIDEFKNTLRKWSSEVVLSSDKNIRQSVVEKYTYREFLDGRLPILKRVDSVVKRTGQQDKVTTVKYHYNKQNSLMMTEYEPSGIVKEIGYSDKGVVVSNISYHRDSPDTKFKSKSEIAENGQRLSEYDASGRYKTSCEYVHGTNKVAKITDCKGNSIVYGYDPRIDIINSISTTVDDQRNGTDYKYTAGLLTGLKSGHTQFEYEYDEWCRPTKIRQGGVEYVSYQYAKQNYNPHIRQKDGSGEWIEMGEIECDTVVAEYASGEKYTSYADKYGRLLAVHYASSGKDSKEEVAEKVITANYYELDKQSANYGRLTMSLDYTTAQTTYYTYDSEGNVTQQTSKGQFVDNVECANQLMSIAITKDIKGRVDRLTYEIDERTQEYIFGYDKPEQSDKGTKISLPDDEQYIEITLPSRDRLTYDTDELNRLCGENIENVLNTEYEYVQHHECATHLVNVHAHRYGGRQTKTRYVYDGRGNIVEVRDSFNRIQSRYKYDALNRLTREDNRASDKTYVMTYDNNGNIQNKQEYKFTLIDNIEYKTLDNSEKIEYNYSIDSLLSYNDEYCEYDSLGNPVVYRDKVLKWSNLRDMTSYDEVEYNYNVSGLRVYRDYTVGRDGEKEIVTEQSGIVELWGGTQANENTVVFEEAFAHIPKVSYKLVDQNGNVVDQVTRDSYDILMEVDSTKVVFKWRGTNFQKPFAIEWTAILVQQWSDERYESYCHWANDRMVSETRKVTTNEWITSQKPNQQYDKDLIVHTQTTTVDYMYGVNGIIGLIVEKGTDEQKVYYYIKNLLGDVIKVIDQQGRVVAEYSYNAWGQHTITSYTEDKIGDLNPIRYRGYYYDDTVKLYYLKSRWYDSEVGRFINQDDVSVLQESKSIINGLNLYSYCNNNPIMRVDPSGYSWWDDFWGGVGDVFNNIGNWLGTPSFWKVIGGVAVIVGLGVLTLVTNGATTPLFVGSISGAVSGILSGITFENGKLGWNGDAASDGFLLGSITGALAGGLSGVLSKSISTLSVVAKYGVSILGNMAIAGGLTAMQGIMTGSFSWDSVAVATIFGSIAGILDVNLKDTFLGKGLIGFSVGLTLGLAEGTTILILYILQKLKQKSNELTFGNMGRSNIFV